MTLIGRCHFEWTAISVITAPIESAMVTEKEKEMEMELLIERGCWRDEVLWME